jgi:NADH dehydrogenase (ubiquinone) 1 alpha subcomplex subunit 12
LSQYRRHPIDLTLSFFWVSLEVFDSIVLAMSTLGRTLKNFMRAGPASSWRQLQFIGDTKYGALIGTDSVGNKYFENNDEIYGMAHRVCKARYVNVDYHCGATNRFELIGRERWVEYASNDPDPAQITPDW